MNIKDLIYFALKPFMRDEKTKNRIKRVYKLVCYPFEQAEIKNINKRYKNKIKQLKNSDKKIKIAFFISQNQLWCVQSLYEKFAENPKFEPVIVAFPNGEDKVKPPDETCRENYDFFKKLKMNVIYGFNFLKNDFKDFKEIFADIVFYDQPYPFFPKKLLFDEVSKHALICYVPYGYKIANAYEANFNMDLQNKAWKVFAESPWHKRKYGEYGKTKAKNVIVSGYPKLDVYNNPFSQGDLKNNSKKRVIWAPHWSFRTNILRYSTFDLYYKDFLKYAKNTPEIDWVLKPHPRVRYHAVESGLMSEKEIEGYFKEWNRLKNAKFYYGGNYFDIFKTSDALITDCSSFLAEYLPTEKPIIHLISKNSAGYNEIGSIITGAYYKAYTFDDVKTLIENVILNKNDYLKSQRLSALEHVVVNKNGAGAFIAKHIEEEIFENEK